jgi:geranylgeranyl reductase family protein
VTEQAPPAGTPATVPSAAAKASRPARAGQDGDAAQPSPRESSARAARRGVGGDSAEVIVVGAGPAGSSVAFYLASAGLDVLLLEKSHFPREKVCGDGLTPRAVKALTAMGVPISEADGWPRNKGLRIIGGGGRIELPWPDLSSYPGFGMVRTRLDFDEILARHAQKAGARLLEGTNVTGPLLDDRTGRIVGVTARQAPAGAAAGTGHGNGPGSASGSELSAEREYRARLVVAADGNSSRLSVAMGLLKRDDRPLGVAVRTYYTSPRHDDDYLEAWLDLWDGTSLLPGYGWIFGMGDGRSNVGLGLLNTSSAFGNIDYKDLLRRWLGAMPPEWGFTEENRTEPVRGAALPMGFNRTPHYTRGVLLAGDAGGMVNPFNGEGIAYALESAEIAARVIVQALARPTAASAERALQAYSRELKDAYGGYYTLGRTFVKLIGQPEFMKFATRHGVKRPAVMRFTMKLLGNLTETRGGDALDRMLHALSKMTPAA